MTLSLWVNGRPNANWESFVSKNGEADGWQLRQNHNGPDVGLTVRDTGAANDDQRVGPEPDPSTRRNNSYKKDVLR